MNILIYHPANSSAKDLESLTDNYLKNGNNVFLLTLTEKGILHNKMEKLGAQVYSAENYGFLYNIKQMFFLIRFCWKNDIDVVYANLQQCSLIAVCSQYFFKAKVITCRHHSDSVRLFGTKKEKFVDKLINTFSRKISVISKFSYNEVVIEEKVNSKKVVLVPLGYNFNLFDSPNQQTVNQIREKYKAKLVVTIVGRLIPLKRVDLAIKAIKDLVDEGYDMKLLILGSGELFTELDKMISSQELSDRVFMIGHVQNVYDYLAASDVLIHVSCSEASCHMPKEAGILSKPVIVCENVGDFSDYLINNINGVLLSKDNPVPDLKKALIAIYKQELNASELGNALKQTVLQTFDINEIIKIHKTQLLDQ